MLHTDLAVPMPCSLLSQLHDRRLRASDGVRWQPHYLLLPRLSRQHVVS